MNNAMFKKLKRKPKWKLRKEREELQEQQRLLRLETEKLEARLSGLKDDEIVALKGNDGESIAVIESQIKKITSKIEANDKRYKNNADILEVYSKIIKNDKEGNNSTATTVAAWVTGIGGLALGYLGLKKSYEYDMDGEKPLLVIRPKTREFMKSIPIIKNFGSFKK